jgi:hypothetical protein
MVSAQVRFRPELLSEEGFSAEQFLLKRSLDLASFLKILLQYTTWCSADL